MSGRHGISSEEALLFERLASRVLHGDASLRAAPEILAQSTLGQAGLWPHGISGDLAILLVRVSTLDGLVLARQALQAQEYWRLKGLAADVVIVNESAPSYLDELHAALNTLLDNGSWRTWKHRPGGVYLLRGDGRSEPERLLLASVAKAILSDQRGTLAQQLDRIVLAARDGQGVRLVPSAPASAAATPEVPPALPQLSLFNGLGGFADGGREYVI
ncbi:MAG TPA: hypothetical protein VF414_02395, partial [Thermoanaerobaculia bacterium]